MQPTISQQDITIFSSDPAGAKEQPGSPFYTDGVDVGYTAPAKWWNWFWNKLTIWLTASKVDRLSMRSELLNTLSSEQITPDASDTHQLSEAINKSTKEYCSTYDNKQVTDTIEGVEVIHKVNQPYVLGHTLTIPASEML